MTKSQKKNVRGRPRTVQKKRAIELAMETYWKDGIQTLSLNELCRRSKISKPALYREFGNEDGLMKAALEYYRQVVIAPLLGLSELQKPFSLVAELAIVEMTSDRGTPAGCLFTQMRLMKPRLGEVTLKYLKEVEIERRGVFEDWYRKALEAGEVNSELQAEFAAEYIDTQFTIVLAQMYAGESPESIRNQARLAFQVLLK